ncbi:MAG: DNA adenine methylase [Mesorhizobium sp.]|uniref:DNA adenine methylase n=2 Tax=Mesorhizobium sp. TaxID=1871066 RepID=UPI000FE790DA|nr:DNA adenine methylase [Mesorhizobium sp.]RWG48548.1 MAG: DNA adenine methylase [Mesorhizobium sp.]RWH44925.1 MAG: DNA adenine methylase [Mesorhizobium sp.]
MSDAPTRPVLRWHGGKWRLAPWIISHFPKHKAYVEAFGGAASVLMQKAPGPAECYNDLDDACVNVFRVLRDPAMAARLRELLELTPFARLELQQAHTRSEDPVEQARRTIVLSFQGHGSDAVTRGYTTGFRSNLSNGRALPAQSWASWTQAIPAFTSRLAGVVIEHTDALALMRRLDRHSTLHYVDPPYLPATRSTKYISRNKNGYRHELTHEQHLELLEGLRQLAGMVVLSGYPSKVYDDLLPGWRRFEIDALADGARERIEVIWLNPACADALDDAAGRHAGGHGTPLFSVAP